MNSLGFRNKSLYYAAINLTGNVNIFSLLISDIFSIYHFWNSMISSSQSIIGVPSGNTLPPNSASKYGWSKTEVFVNAL